MLATYASRDANGCASGLRFCLCRRDGWPGGKRSNKVGNTCQTHCVGIRIQNCLVGGVLQPEVEMRKCMWLRCCYGKKPYGSPPAIPCESPAPPAARLCISKTPKLICWFRIGASRVRLVRVPEEAGPAEHARRRGADTRIA